MRNKFLRLYGAANRPASEIVGPNTVMVDFTADYCQTCHYYEYTVLDTARVIDSLKRLGVVTVRADWSESSPNRRKVGTMLGVLGSRQIPVIAVFSAKDPNHPSVFRGGYTQDGILRAGEGGTVAGSGRLIPADDLTPSVSNAKISAEAWRWRVQ